MDYEEIEKLRKDIASLGIDIINMIENKSKIPKKNYESYLNKLMKKRKEKFAELSKLETKIAGKRVGKILEKELEKLNQNKQYPEKKIVYYHYSDFISLEEYITAMQKGIITDKEAKNVDWDNFYDST